MRVLIALSALSTLINLNIKGSYTEFNWGLDHWDLIRLIRVIRN